ncbi:MarR family transcriptional regulator [Streptomyces sp. NPDC048566]|uniref:MarR family transcriptional regulator n=1 Tax=Streptomyces sp. NPDC048566 TaxID=3365569 RepID=UPI003718FC9D
MSTPVPPTASASPTAPPPPPVDGRVIGLAHYASRAALERVLARSGTSFEQSAALRAVADQGGTVERAWLVDRLTGTLKIGDAAAHATVREMAARRLLTEQDAGQVALTGSGRHLFAAIRAESDAIAARLYAGIPAGDLATTGRVLALVTERADAESERI